MKMMKSRESKHQSADDTSQFSAIENLFKNEKTDLIERIEGFPKYVTRKAMANFMAKYEIFKKILHVNGSIIECGVLYGAGLLTWAKLSSVLEPVNHTRKIIGFDTFEGFPHLHEKDTRTGTSRHLNIQGLKGSAYENILKAVEVYDTNRPLKHIPKVEIVKGDICKTAEKYLKENPQLVVSLLYLDFDLYSPTKKALEIFVPRMPKGAIVCFDELNAKIFPGETMAVDEVVGLPNIRIQRFPFEPYISYAVL